MIHNDEELTVTRERIEYFLRLITDLRTTSDPEEFPLVAGGFRSEVERMQTEVLNYLTRQITRTAAKAG